MKIDEKAVRKGEKHFGKILRGQLERVERLKKEEKWIDYRKLRPMIIGIIGGDGIGPSITKQAQRVLAFLLIKELDSGKVKFKTIEGLTIENRAKQMKSIPDDILREIKKCHVLLKGPTTTPKKGDKWPNLESANVMMRRELDLFANVRPVKVVEKGINWTFFRENTEGAYILGSRGIEVTPDLAIDFKAITTQGTERIVRLAFEYAKKNGINRVSAVTKANVVKTSDGKFLSIAEEIAKEYPGIEFDSWFVDIFAAKLIDPNRRTQFRVVVLPNLYGDIITDEAAQLQGGVGTAGSANIGKRYAMFEAIHGTAPRMVEEDRTKYADPSSVIRAGAMLLRHIGFEKKAERVEGALDVSRITKAVVVTGRSNGATGKELTDHLIWLLDKAIK